MFKLSSHQEESLIRVAQSENPSSAKAITTLHKLFHPFIEQLSNPLSRYGVSREDLYQEGCIGLIEAIKKFDLQKGLRLSTYADPCIRSKMYTFLRKEQKSCTVKGPNGADRLLHLSDPVSGNGDVGGTIFREDSIPDKKNPSPENYAETSLLSRLIVNACRDLTQLQRKILHLRFWEEYRPSEIAETLKLSRPRVSQVLKTTLRKLEPKLERAISA